MGESDLAVRATLWKVVGCEKDVRGDGGSHVFFRGIVNRR